MHSERLAYIKKLNDQEELSREDVQALITEVERMRYLLRMLVENDPFDTTADGGVTVLDVWRDQAETLLNK